MLRIYSSVMGASSFLLRSLLKRRCRKGKEDPQRLGERMGQPGHERPEGKLIWIHAASVGESQSALILIQALLERHKEAHVLITTGTVTSAHLMEKRLPSRALHQYYPVDHPKWVAGFLDHWQPDMAIWMESEIWPNMLAGIKKRQIPAAVVNGRLSPRSFKRWKKAGNEIGKLLDVFSIVLTQTDEDADYFTGLGARNVIVSDNLKYSAAPLPYDENDLERMQKAVSGRTLWVFASTHDPEEEMACRIHQHLQKKVPDLLTIIVPRHPERRNTIVKACDKYGVKTILRGDNKTLPSKEDQIYIVDTFGELGLFYRLCPLACIGRSFSKDGGGGHNPIEAAQLGCAVMHGPLVQNLAEIYQEFDKAGAAIMLKNEQDFQKRLERLLSDSDGLDNLQDKATRFAQKKGQVLDTVMKALEPLLDDLGEEKEKEKQCA